MKLIRLFGLVVLAIIALWFMFFFLAGSQILRPNIASELDPQVAERLSKAFNDLEFLRKQNEELRKLFNGINIGNNREVSYEELKEKLKTAEKLLEQTENNVRQNPPECIKIPTIEYEKTRRKIKNGVQEFWYFINGELKKLSIDADPSKSAEITRILNDASEHKKALLNDLIALENADGYNPWREREAKELSDLVQRRLRFLQNPKNCNEAKKLVCNVNKGCGFGCQLHHTAYCLIVAYATERTLILKSKGWHYHRSGWEEVFKPVSDTCTDFSGQSRSVWPGKDTTQVVELPVLDSLSPRPPYLPLAVPADLANRLGRLHGDPFVWWAGQLLHYLLRPQRATQLMLDDIVTRLDGFKSPIVGIHIRRTDKVGTEAAFHTIAEYMTAVEDYYSQLAMRQDVPVKRVYIASDDPNVISDARKKFPSYEILGDPEIAKTAALSTRYTDSSLNGIITDIYLLSKTDFVVCTFSSQVCRVVYELMQLRYPDASDRFRSLDDIYYYGGQSAHNRIAVLPHKSRRPGEMDLKIGDIVGVAGNHWDGYSKGKNIRSNQIGLYPSFKVIEKVVAVDFPTYPEVPMQ